MSNLISIATVSRTLKELLVSELDERVSEAFEGKISISNCSPILLNGSKENNLNLFLYRITPNAALRNPGFPTHRGQGQLTADVPLSVNLHYILTAYCKDEIQSELLLGYGMQVIHECPFLGKEHINRLLKQGSSSGTGIRSGAESAEKVEQIKILPENLSLTEVTNLWSAFRVPYRPSVTYIISAL